MLAGIWILRSGFTGRRDRPVPTNLAQLWVPRVELHLIEGHMSHPGMAPVLATATERADGVYEAELQFTMRGERGVEFPG